VVVLKTKTGGRRSLFPSVALFCAADLIWRHAELVSASNGQQSTAPVVERWTLKQVQGDGIF
jgi:hypothetical protein